MYYNLQEDEVHPYQRHYISLVQEAHPIVHLEHQSESEYLMLQNLTAEQWSYRYAEGKWTIGEVYLHVLDTERIMMSRALWVARGSTLEQPGFDQDAFAVYADASRYSPESFLIEYSAQRRSTMSFFQHLTDEELLRKAVISGAPMSVRTLMYVIAGHTTHHYQVLNEKYL